MKLSESLSLGSSVNADLIIRKKISGTVVQIKDRFVLIKSSDGSLSWTPKAYVSLKSS